MLPMIAVREELGTLLAADATTLAPAANANKLALIIAPFSPNENLTLAGLTLGAGHGLDPILGVVGAQVAALDPLTQEQVILIKAPAGGYKWVTSGGLAVAITIYGYALVDNAAAVLLAVQALPNPITVNADGYLIDVDPVEMRFVLAPIS